MKHPISQINNYFNLKHVKLVFILFFSALQLESSAQTTKTIFSKINKVTVYLQGATLYYSENVPLQVGYNEMVFENISPHIQSTSLQSNSKGAVVMDIKHQIKYKEKIAVAYKYDKEIENVLDSIENIDYEIKDIDNKIYVLETEKNMLLTNRIIKGTTARDSLPLLKEGMNFLKEKLNSIYEQNLKLERNKNKLQKIKNKLDMRYNALTLLQNGQLNSDYSTAQSVHQVIVTLYCESATTANVTFNYYIPTANWIPIYDLQASSLSNNFQLKYFANVTQNSGLEWTNVPLTLSTSNPAESNIKPEINPWYLSFANHLRKEFELKALSNADLPINSETKTNNDKIMAEDMDDNSLFVQKYVAVMENIIRTEYQIKLNYSIANDGKSHKVLINQKEIPMLMQFAAVPKICTDAFLMAKITGWEDMNIIPGNAKLYFDGSFIGEMYLDATGSEDTMSINLGRDKSIALTRKKLKEDFKDKILVDEKVEIRTIEIVVRNTKNIPVELLIEDQIPIVTGTNNIIVELVDGDGAVLDQATGKLTWRLKLKVKESEKIKFTYSIKYPKGKTIVGL